jgi:Fic family protein
MDEAVAAVDNEAPPDEPTEAWHAVRGYQQAMTCILQTAQDPPFDHSKQLLKALQFMMTAHDAAKANPGQFRPGQIGVVATATGEQVYEAPDYEAVNGLVDELIDYLRQGPVESALVTGALAHLNLTMIHPFRDGNGRMARALQTLVLALEGHFDPVFSSIEEWLGNNNSAYYKILDDVGHGTWRPEGDASPWVRFCLVAHHQQAARHIRRNEEYGRLYERIEAIMEREGLHDRIALPLFDVALGLSLTNTKYRSLTSESQFTATRDLKTLAQIGVLAPKSQGRARHYVSGEELRKARAETRIRKPLANPYEELTRKV